MIAERLNDNYIINISNQKEECGTPIRNSLMALNVKLNKVMDALKFLFAEMF